MLLKTISGLIKKVRGEFATHGRCQFVGDELFFASPTANHGIELWKSDGTAEGTVMVRDIRLGDGNSGPADLTEVGGVLYFRANDGTNGTELWKSDGTPEGTVLVKDITPGGIGSNPTNLTASNGLLFFNAVHEVFPKMRPAS